MTRFSPPFRSDIAGVVRDALANGLGYLAGHRPEDRRIPKSGGRFRLGWCANGRAYLDVDLLRRHAVELGLDRDLLDALPATTLTRGATTLKAVEVPLAAINEGGER